MCLPTGAIHRTRLVSRCDMQGSERARDRVGMREVVRLLWALASGFSFLIFFSFFFFGRKSHSVSRGCVRVCCLSAVYVLSSPPSLPFFFSLSVVVCRSPLSTLLSSGARSFTSGVGIGVGKGRDGVAHRLLFGPLVSFSLVLLSGRREGKHGARGDVVLVKGGGRTSSVRNASNRV